MNKAKLFFFCFFFEVVDYPPLAWKKFNVMKEMLDYFEMEVITRSAKEKKENQHDNNNNNKKNVVAQIFSHSQNVCQSNTTFIYITFCISDYEVKMSSKKERKKKTRRIYETTFRHIMCNPAVLKTYNSIVPHTTCAY